MKTNFIRLNFLLIFIGFYGYTILSSNGITKSMNQYSFININVSFGRFDQSEHSHCQTWFSCSGSPDDSNFFSTRNRTLNLFEYQRKSVTISQAVFFKVHFTLKNWLEQNKGLNKGYPKVGKFPKVDGLETLKSQSSKKNDQIKEIELVQKTHHLVLKAIYQEFSPAQFLVETLMFSNLDRFVFGRDRVQRKYFISG